MEQRLNQLRALSMKFTGDEYVGKEEWNSDFNVHITEIAMDEDDVWDEKIAKLEKEFAQRQEVKTCDFCDEEFQGRNFPTHDENLNGDNNNRCIKCFGESLMED